MKNNRARQAFTLIELLVVIAIIAILAAILFPVFAQAKAAAKKIACLSEEKQIGLAWVMYSNDYDDTMPIGTGANYISGDWSSGTFYTVLWFETNAYSLSTGLSTDDYSKGMISPYVKNTQILQQGCATDTLKLQPSGSPASTYGLNEDIYTGGDYITLGDSIFKANPYGVTTYAQVQSPAETMLMAESASLSLDGTPYRYQHFEPGEFASAHAYGIHNGFTNVGWCDGHSKAMKTTPSATFPYNRSPAQTQTEVNEQTAYSIGDVLRAPLDEPFEGGTPFTPAQINSVYYYLLDKTGAGY